MFAMEQERNADSFTVVQLKEILRRRGLSSAGTKSELIRKLNDQDPSGTWKSELEETEEPLGGTGSEPGAVGGADVDAAMQALGQQQQAEYQRRELELVQRELDVARRELQVMREMQRLNIPSGIQQAGHEHASAAHSRVNLTAVADLLSFFSGNTNEFENWERQLALLRATYGLDERATKILIGMRLKGRALEWLHSKPEHIGMHVDSLLTELRGVFHFPLSRLIRRRQFEERTWKRNETFQEYAHDKIILANRVPVDEEEIVDYLIEGIPDVRLRDQALMGGYSSTAALLKALEKITLRDGGQQNASRRTDRQDTRNSGQNGGRRERASGERPGDRTCYNCGMRDHIGIHCPTKAEGPICFRCGVRGHLASKCPKRSDGQPKNSCAASKVSPPKFKKQVEVNDHKVTALIDTGSDLCLMREDLYVRIGSPLLSSNEVRFRGIGSGENITLGEFRAKLRVDGNAYSIVIRVIPNEIIEYEFLMGADFLDTVDVRIRAGSVYISPLHEQPAGSSDLPEVFQINVCDEAAKQNVDVAHIPRAEYREAIEKLVCEYTPVRTREVGVKMSIVLKDEEPVFQRARRLAPTEREKVNEQIGEWLREKIIQPSLSEYASPVVLVKRKDGTMRLCIDYRRLNEKVVRDRYPLPLIEDQLDLLQSAKYYSTLDLKNGFFHVALEEQSRKFTAFIVPDGHYEFLRAPFGLCNSPSVFQRYINAVFKDLIRDKIVLTYIDDLIIPSEDYESGLSKLRAVLATASEAGLSINWKKCCFLKEEVEYLGHIVQNGRVRPSARKVEAVRKFPEPTNVKQVQSFLGLSGYFRKFVPQYASIARPLSNLLKGGTRFKFGDEERIAFLRLKEILSEKPVLCLYRQGAETQLHTDASMYGYGAILLQRNAEDGKMHPVYYASGKTTPAESRYTSYELEVLAIIKALRKFRVYLLGIPFKILTDCRAFALTMRKRDLCVRVARWALLLEEYQYEIEHRSGKSMVHVDALSRSPLPQCMVIGAYDDTITSQFKRAQREDKDVERILELATQGNIEGYVVRGELLFKEVDGNLLLVVPSSMRSQVIRKAHERGHFSATKTEALLRNDYWFPNAKAKIEQVVRNCVECILANRKQGRMEGLLNPLNKGITPLETFHIDHLGPLPSTKKSYRHILVVVDAFSKFTWLYATRSTGAGEVITRLRKQAAVFGNPYRIISDRGAAFTSEEFAKYCEDEKIQHQLITTGVPRGNGQVERVNRTLLPLLTKLAHPKREEWYRYLELAQQCLNVTMHRSIGTTPFRVLFGTHARLRDNPEVRELLEKEWVMQFEAERDEIRDRSRRAIEAVQKENREGYDRKRVIASEYRDGDLVAIKRTQQGPGLKLANKFLGPYRIVRKLRNDRYVVEKTGDHEGPLRTSTAADYMKPWAAPADDESDADDSMYDIRGRISVQDGRM